MFKFREINKCVLFFPFLILLSCGKKAETASPQKTMNSKTYTILGLGDSYTFGESVKPQYRYLNQLQELLISKGISAAEPKIIAQTGWTTQELLKSKPLQEDDQSYDLVFLLIGVNNEYRGFSPESYVEEFTLCLDKAIQKAQGKNNFVFVLSIPDYSVTEFAGRKPIPNTISERIDAYNKINESISEEKKVNYIEITSHSRTALTDETLIAIDGLHPSEKMYAHWAAEILKVLENIIPK